MISDHIYIGDKSCQVSFSNLSFDDDDTVAKREESEAVGAAALAAACLARVTLNIALPPLSLLSLDIDPTLK